MTIEEMRENAKKNREERVRKMDEYYARVLKPYKVEPRFEFEDEGEEDDD